MTTPSRIGGYEIGARVESFPLGELLEATDEAGDPHLLLRLDGDRLRSRVDPERVVSTVNRYRALAADGVLPFVGAGMRGDDLVVVLRATDGPTLADVLARGAMEPKRALGIAIRIARTLDGLGAAGVIHGDVRPGATHLPGGGEVLLGAPALLPLGPDERDPSALAPEVLDGGESTAASDVFALGSLLYAAATGRPPFEGRTAAEVRASIRRGVIDNPGKHASDIPAGMPELLLEMLDEDPENRPTNVLARLEAVERGAPILTPVEAGTVSSVPSPATAPGTPVRASRSVPRQPRAATKEQIGRLLLPARGAGEPLIHDLLDAVVLVGLTANGRIVARDHAPPTEVCRIVREGTGDVVDVPPDASERPRVNGSLFDRHELREGDVITVGGQDVRYVLAPPPPRVATPAPAAAAAARAEAKGSERLFLAVSGILCLAILVGLYVAQGNVRRRGQEVFDAADAAERSREHWKPRTEAEASRQSAAEAALDEALKFAGDGPEERDTRRAALEQVISTFAGTEAAIRAAGELDRMLREADEAERRESAEFDRKADRLIAEGRLHDARTALYEMADRWPRTESADRAMRRAARIAGEIADRWERDLKTIEAMCRDGDVPGALARLDAVSVYAGPKIRQEAQDRVDLLRKMIQETMLKDPPAGKPAEPGPGPGDPAAAGGEKPEPGPPPPPPPPPPPDPKAEAEARAQKLVDRAWTDARAGKLAQVRELTRLLLASFGGTSAVSDDLAQLEVLDRYAALTVEGQVGGLRGRVETLAGGRVRVTYDFSDEGQAKDWVYLLPFSGDERGSFGPVPGKAMVRGRGRGAYLLDLVLEGDLKMGFRIRSEKPHDVGALLFDPDDPYRQIMYTVNNTFFTLGAEKSPLVGNVIALWGKTVWADNPKGELGFVRIAEKKTPVVQPGQWTYLAVGRKGEQASFSIENDTISARARGDDNLPYGDLKPSLFVLDSEAEFTDVVIEGRPSRSWLANEKRRLQKILDLK